MKIWKKKVEKNNDNWGNMTNKMFEKCFLSIKN